MPRHTTDLELQKQISELTGIVVEGFKGVHARQDITNGRIGKVEGRVDALERKESYLSGGRGAAKYIIALILAIGAIVVAILYH